MEDEGYPFKKINEVVYESDGYVEEDWYELRGTDSLDATARKKMYNISYGDKWRTGKRWQRKKV